METMNQKILAAVISVAMVVGMAGAAAAGGETTGVNDPGETYIAAVDTPHGVVALTEEEADEMASSQGDTGPNSCGGDAPLETYCTTGDYTSNFGAIHWCVAGPSFTGQVESRLAHDDGARTYVCTFQDGEYITSFQDGEWPDAGEEFTHEGYAYFVGAPALSPVGDQLPENGVVGQPSGIPGGDGHWTVRISTLICTICP